MTHGNDGRAPTSVRSEESVDRLGDLCDPNWLR